MFNNAMLRGLELYTRWVPLVSEKKWTDIAVEVIRHSVNRRKK